MAQRKTRKIKEYRRIQQDGVIYYGKHLIVTGRDCNEALLDTKRIAAFMKHLVNEIDMVAFGEPIVERFGQGVEIGVSAVQLIETSAIVMHTNDQARDMYLDVFSCKSFSEHIVFSCVQKAFNPSTLNYQVLMR